MNIKLDENLPRDLITLLEAQGHDVHTVAAEKLVGMADEVIFEAATREARLLFTQDLDFSDVRKYRPGTHHGLVLVRLRQPSRRRILARVTQVLSAHSIETWARCFVVISDRKLRIRRPTP